MTAAEPAGISPGRAAYEAYDARLGPIDDPGYVGPFDVPLTPWEDVRQPERDAWEAAAYDDDPCLRCQAIGQRCGKAEPR